MPGEARQSAASAAAEQVRSIVAAAEQSAAALEAAAREEAERVRDVAERDASAAREAAERLAGRAEELERRLEELAAGVREAMEAIRADLAALRPSRGAPTEEPERPQPSDEVDEELIAEVEEVAATSPDVKAPEGVAPGAGPPEGARLLALKMALDGSPRDDTARYLRENFELEDPERLLDEVYAKAGR